MIDRDLLTEALDYDWRNELIRALEAHARAHWNNRLTKNSPITRAARLLLDFPTDEQVEAADQAYVGAIAEHPDPVRNIVEVRREAIRAALVTVRDTMIGDNQ